MKRAQTTLGVVIAVKVVKVRNIRIVIGSGDLCLTIEHKMPEPGLFSVQIIEDVTQHLLSYDDPLDRGGEQSSIPGENHQ